MASRPPLPPLPPQHRQQQHHPSASAAPVIPPRPPLPPLPPAADPRRPPGAAAAPGGPPPPPLPSNFNMPVPSISAPSIYGNPAPPAPAPYQPRYPTPDLRNFSPTRQSPLPPPPTGAVAAAAAASPAPAYPSTFIAAPTPQHPRRISTGSFTSLDGSTTSTSTTNTLNAALSQPLPDPKTLATSREKALALGDPNRLIQWASDIVKYVERKSTLTANSGTAAEADLTIKDAQLVAWIDEAINIINSHATKQPKPVPRALYLRGDLLASGSFPSYHPRDLRSAFSDFEMAARMGYPPAYFRCARDYEVLGDVSRAKEVYEKGMGKGDVCCTYRLGMANLLGQLGCMQNLPYAAQLLREAADRADLETPQPAYIYGIMLAGEFAQVAVPPNLLMPALVTDPNRANMTPQQQAHFDAESFRYISRAAFLHFAPAQLKCGWAFEHAQLGCAFDPLLSVQYYILASQGGELEADLSLSKWFLCGAEGFFPKKEDLAFVFADKAARKGLASAEFALGYYYEVGVGTEKNLDSAKKWYRKAATHGNSDAQERLDDLAKPQPHELNRNDHQAHIDAKLVRKRTQAQIKSDNAGRSNGPSGASHPSNGGGQHKQAVDVSRRQTMKMVDAYTSIGRPGPGLPAPWSEATASPTSSNGNRRQGRQEASMPNMHVPNTLHRPLSASASSVNSSVSQGQHGAGYSLSESYQHQHPAAPGSSQAGHGIVSSGSASSGLMGTSPGRKVLAKPSPAIPVHATTAAARPGLQPSAFPQQPAQGQGQRPTQAQYPGGAGAGGRTKVKQQQQQSATGPGGEPVYTTFAEMGFAPKPSGGEKDCVIM
ncbi:hypothetical protein A4X09_0g6396 [Tilletia walkeri]|uniref:Chitin synthase regulator 3 n=1 Tax=Tilletia walkeri TaxID=117179 RepID=A0A8X7N5A0_9BASI|nr:hypothetical protein A4X09_0g6396 [Tilletia walkeri]